MRGREDESQTADSTGGRREPLLSPRWLIATIAVSAVIRFLFVVWPNLIFEEAYYWLYSQHLALGYIDHPPMVAWVIAAGTALFGNTEFGVRIAAFLGWFATAGATALYARELAGQRAILPAVFMLSIFPYFVMTGSLMSPDVVLAAAWAGSLFFLHRAILGRGRWEAWLGAGACIGVGMLSKYSIALLGISTLVFLAIDPGSRRWYLRPKPYACAAVAALAFSPVIYWNWTNDWISFKFQSTARLAASHQFDLPALLVCIVALLTPAGVMAYAPILVRGAKATFGLARGRDEDRTLAFTAVYTLVPLGVFTFASLQNETKLNWTGPLWLAALPLVASWIAGGITKGAGRWERIGAKLWKPSIVLMGVVYSAMLFLTVSPHAASIPGTMAQMPSCWPGLARKIETIQKQVLAETGTLPAVVGYDKNRIASLLSFYDSDGLGNDEIASRNLFGKSALMFAIWNPAKRYIGSNLIVVVDREAEDDILDQRIADHAKRVGPVERFNVVEDGVDVGAFSYRIVYGLTAKK